MNLTEGAAFPNGEESCGTHQLAGEISVAAVMAQGPQLPDGWQRKRIKYVALYNPEVLPEDTDDHKKIEYIEIAGVSLTKGVEKATSLHFHEAPLSAKRIVRSGDTLVSTVRTYLKAIATIRNAPDNLVASTGFCVIRPGPGVIPDFLGWVMKSDPIVESIVARSRGVCYPTVNAKDVVNLEIPIPPVDIQCKIAQFLNEKTAQIDALVEGKRTLLNHLAEMRQAFITYTTTRSIDTKLTEDAAFLSGEESSRTHSKAGEISATAVMAQGTQLPDGWQRKRIKYLALYNSEVLPEDTDDFKEIEYIEIANVSLTKGAEKTTSLRFHEAPLSAKRIVRSGDTLVSTVRTYLKAIATIRNAPDNLVASTGFCVIRPGPGVIPDFLGWVMKSDPIVESIVARSRGVCYPTVNAKDVVNLKIPIPPIDTQRQIAQFLDKKTAQIDTISDQITRSIALLQEYRAALITVVVTGQADLEKWNKRNSANRMPDTAKEEDSQ